MNNPENINRGLSNDNLVDIELLKQIIEIQDLPEEVVIRLLNAKGSLSSTEFGKLIS